jgi:hypothetical protein
MTTDAEPSQIAEPTPYPTPAEVIEAEREMRVLRRDFPRYTISIDYPPGGARYTATRKEPGPGPYLAITKDPLELREALPAGPAPSSQAEGAHRKHSPET